MSIQLTAWWREAIIYQVYPRNFLDTNGAGVGDLTPAEQRVASLVLEHTATAADRYSVGGNFTRRTERARGGRGR